MAIAKRDVDKLYTALRPRLGARAGGVYVAPPVIIPPHTHSADQIGSDATPLVEGVNVQAAVEELDDEKLARSGAQTMLGDLDHDHHSIANVDDADIEGTATVGEDVIFTEGVGGAKLSSPRVITLAGAESDGEGRVESVNGIAFNSIAPTVEVGKLALDGTEDTLVFFVTSGASLVLVSLGWAVKLAANGYNG